MKEIIDIRITGGPDNDELSAAMIMSTIVNKMKEDAEQEDLDDEADKELYALGTVFTQSFLNESAQHYGELGAILQLVPRSAPWFVSAFIGGMFTKRLLDHPGNNIKIELIMKEVDEDKHTTCNCTCSDEDCQDCNPDNPGDDGYAVSEVSETTEISNE